MSLYSRCIARVLWVVWHAEIVGSPSFVTPLASSSSSTVDQLCSVHTRASGPPPACIYYSTVSWWTLWTRIPLLSSLSFHPSLSVFTVPPCWSWQSITTITTPQDVEIGCRIIAVFSSFSMPCLPQLWAACMRRSGLKLLAAR